MDFFKWILRKDIIQPTGSEKSLVLKNLMTFSSHLNDSRTLTSWVSRVQRSPPKYTRTSWLYASLSFDSFTQLHPIHLLPTKPLAGRRLTVSTSLWDLRGLSQVPVFGVFWPCSQAYRSLSQLSLYSILIVAQICVRDLEQKLQSALPIFLLPQPTYPTKCLLPQMDRNVNPKRLKHLPLR